jgi:hypothetical protein
MHLEAGDGGVELSQVTVSGFDLVSNSGDPGESSTVDIDATDNSPNTTRTEQNWVDAHLGGATSQLIAGYGQVKGKDGNILQMPAVNTTFTITYTPSGAALFPPFRRNRLTTVRM